MASQGYDKSRVSQPTPEKGGVKVGIKDGPVKPKESGPAKRAC